MMARFSDVLTIINGKNQSKVVDPVGQYPIYGSGGIMGYANDYICEAETVIIGRKGNINKPIFVETPFWNVDTAFGLWANRKILLPKYLYYFCQYFDFERLNTTVTIPSLTKANLLDIEIDLPSIDDQNTIVAQLDKAEKIISLRKQQLSKLDELVKSRFIEIFGDVINNDRNWPMATMGDVAEIKIGPFGTLLHKEDYIVGGHALVNPSHIVDGKIAVDISLTISDEKYEELSAYHLKIDDIVLGRRGEMGRCAVVREEGLLCGTGSLIIRPNDKLKPYFLQTIISNPTYKKIIEDKAVGVTMMNLNVPIVESLRVPMLPIELQNDFISFTEQVDKSKYEIQKSLEKLETLKKALMQKYFG